MPVKSKAKAALPEELQGDGAKELIAQLSLKVGVSPHGMHTRTLPMPWTFFLPVCVNVQAKLPQDLLEHLDTLTPAQTDELLKALTEQVCTGPYCTHGIPSVCAGCACFFRS